MKQATRARPITKKTCVHEAGHVVAAIIAGVPVDGVFAGEEARLDHLPDEQQSLGYVQLGEGGHVPRGLMKWRKWRPSPLVAIAANSVFISVAGDFAEARRSGRRRSDHTFSGYAERYADYALALDYFHPEGMGVSFKRKRWFSHMPPDQVDAARALVALGLSLKDTENVLRAACEAVSDQVCRGAGWRAVVQIAEALHGDGGYIDRREVYRIAREHLGDCPLRSAVRAVATFSCPELQAIPTKDRPSYPIQMFL